MKRSVAAAIIAIATLASALLAAPVFAGAPAGAATVRAGAGALTAGHPGPPVSLTVDGWAAPAGVDPDGVRFGWVVADPRPGAIEGGYRITVDVGSHLVWDSGRVASSAQSAVAYGGPPLAPDTAYRWSVQTWDGAGKAGPAASSSFGTALRDHDWRAEWITRPPADAVDANDEYTYARREAVLGRSPITRATAYVSADQQYELWINGRQAGKGPAISYPDTQHYEAIDLTADDLSGLLHAGAANAFGLLFRWYGTGKGRPAGQPGAILQVSITHADGSRESVVTDGSWRVERGNWLASTPRNQQFDDIDNTENISGLQEPVGWDQPGYADALWQPATVVGRPPVAPWTHLVVQDTHIAQTPLTPVSLTTLASGAVVADFGKVVAATPVVNFHHGVPGHAVTMRGGYLLDEPAPGQPVVGVPGQVSRTHGTQATDMSWSYVERAGEQTFRAFDYLGYRYYQIDDPGEVLKPSDVIAMTRRNAVPDEQAATFHSSNPTLDAVFELCRNSARYGSQEQFLDTPTREKSPFLRDGFNISETAMAAFGEQELSRRALLEFAQSQARYWPDGRINAVYPSGDGKRDIPDFTEIYPEWVWTYYLRTGDAGLVREVFPVVAAVGNYIARDLDPATGLVENLAGGDDNPDYQHGLVDWPPPMRYGYDMATSVRTTVDMLAVDAFRRIAALAGAAGQASAPWSARADALTAAINARLRRADGLYVDGLHADGSLSPHASQHANAYAISYGIVPPADVAPVATHVASLGMSMGPQTAQELLDALAIAGRDTDLVTRLTDAATPGWANVLAQGGTYTWETWAPSDADGDSMSHGWGATALVEIQERVLGVVPTAPGFARFDVAPLAAGLASASGTVPTPRGPIGVAWRRGAAGGLQLDLTVPANTVATVQPPAPGARPVQVVAGTHHLTSASPSAPLHDVVVPTPATGGAPSALSPSPPSSNGAAPAPHRHHRSSWWWILIAAGAVVLGAAGVVAVRRHPRGVPGAPVR